AVYLMEQLEQGTPYATFAIYSYCVGEGDTSHCLAELGDFEQAMTHAGRSREFAATVGNLVLIAFNEMYAGFIPLRQGNYPKALMHADNWLRNYADAELLLPWQASASRLGPIFNVCERVSDAITLFEKAQQFAQANNLIAFLQPELAWLAHTYSRAGRV